MLVTYEELEKKQSFNLSDIALQITRDNSVKLYMIILHDITQLESNINFQN